MPGKIIVAGFDDSHDKFTTATTLRTGIRGVVGMSFPATSNEETVVINENRIIDVDFAGADDKIKDAIKKAYQAHGRPSKVVLAKARYRNQRRDRTQSVTTGDLAKLSDLARKQSGSSSNDELEQAFRELGPLRELTELPE